MSAGATPIPPIRWRDYVLEKGRALIDFWSEHLGERERSLLLVLGRGFDPRCRLGLEMILAAGGVGRRDVLGLDYDEGEASPSLAYAQRVEDNWTRIGSAVQDRGTIELRRLPFWSGTRRVGPLHAANIFNLPEELARFARALHTAIKKGRGDPTFSPREKVPRRGG